MNSVSPECQTLKDDYDKCFNWWFKDRFLKGDKTEGCVDLFKAYQSCVKNAIKVKGINLDEVKRDVLGTEDAKSLHVPPPKEADQKGA